MVLLCFKIDKKNLICWAGAFLLIKYSIIRYCLHSIFGISYHKTFQYAIVIFHFVKICQNWPNNCQRWQSLSYSVNDLPQKVDTPNQVWISDVTCFKINNKYLYVCEILDLFSRKIVAHRVSPKNSTYLITSTFRQAFKNRNAPQSLMFRSDQGAQYTSKAFRKLLRMNKVVQSFSKSGQPYDNAVMESFFASMKREEIYRTQYKSDQQFVKSVDSYIEFYNTQRPHSTLNYKTPDQFKAIHESKRESAD